MELSEVMASVKKGFFGGRGAYKYSALPGSSEPSPARAKVDRSRTVLKITVAVVSLVVFVYLVSIFV
jgi:hypothetical protein